MLAFTGTTGKICLTKKIKCRQTFFSLGYIHEKENIVFLLTIFS